MAGDRMTKPPAVCEPDRSMHEFEQGANVCACGAKTQFLNEKLNRWEVRDSTARTEPSLPAMVDPEKGTGEFRMTRDAVLSEDMQRLKEFDDLFGKGITAQRLQDELTCLVNARAAAEKAAKSLAVVSSEFSLLAVELFTGLLDYNDVRNGRILEAVKRARKNTILTIEALRDQGGLL